MALCWLVVRHCGLGTCESAGVVPSWQVLLTLASMLHVDSCTDGCGLACCQASLHLGPDSVPRPAGGMSFPALLGHLWRAGSSRRQHLGSSKVTVAVLLSCCIGLLTQWHLHTHSSEQLMRSEVRNMASAPHTH